MAQTLCEPILPGANEVEASAPNVTIRRHLSDESNIELEPILSKNRTRPRNLFGRRASFEKPEEAQYPMQKEACAEHPTASVEPISTKQLVQTHTPGIAKKQYGLILPGDKKKVEVYTPRISIRPDIFNESSDSDDDNDDNDHGNTANFIKMKPNNKTNAMGMGPTAMERQRARNIHQKALAEDPTIFQYDELYDEMASQRDKSDKATTATTTTSSNEPKKPKYIERIMQMAERRKLESELRVERSVQKEREKEGEEFKDKDAFVTSAYRKKLEEMRLVEEREKRDEYLEAIGDVTKQKDLDGFYRHLFEQKLGTSKESQSSISTVTNTKEQQQSPDKSNTTLKDSDTITYKPIISIKSVNTAIQNRAYRQRRVSADDDDDDGDEIPKSSNSVGRTHLQNNIDADSDFSIDSSNSSDEENDNAKGKNEIDMIDGDLEKSATKAIPTKLKECDQKIEKSNVVKEDIKIDDKKITKTKDDNAVPTKPKKNKEIWKKRTVGLAFDDAMQRYFIRKSMRTT